MESIGADIQRDYELAKGLVGDITLDDLKYVDWYVCEDMGIFIPSVGYCGYALKYQHTHPAYSLVVLTGENNGVLDATFQPDQHHYLAAMMSPGIPHEEEAGDTFSRYLALFASGLLVETVCHNCDRELPHYSQWHQFQVPKDIMILLDRFMAESEARRPGYQIVMNSLATIILHDFILYSAGREVQNHFRHHNGIQGAVDFIHQYFHQTIPVAKLAEVANMSITTFSRRFKAHTGQSPGNYLIRTRLEKARKLIRSSKESITDIALQCGFSNTAHMTSLFKRHYGIPPTEYRALHDIDGSM